MKKKKLLVFCAVWLAVVGQISTADEISGLYRTGLARSVSTIPEQYADVIIINVSIDVKEADILSTYLSIDETIDVIRKNVSITFMREGSAFIKRNFQHTPIDTDRTTLPYLRKKAIAPYQQIDTNTAKQIIEDEEINADYGIMVSLAYENGKWVLSLSVGSPNGDFNSEKSEIDTEAVVQLVRRSFPSGIAEQPRSIVPENTPQQETTVQSKPSTVVTLLHDIFTFKPAGLRKPQKAVQVSDSVLITGYDPLPGYIDPTMKPALIAVDIKGRRIKTFHTDEGFPFRGFIDGIISSADKNSFWVYGATLAVKYNVSSFDEVERFTRTQFEKTLPVISPMENQGGMVIERRDDLVMVKNGKDVLQLALYNDGASGIIFNGAHSYSGYNLIEHHVETQDPERRKTPKPVENRNRQYDLNA